ncbi:MAG: zinc ABC transporter substrate-binding protein [Candidatus Schekmanbacteria bacterium]|nr:zinc ABC transporter substrate-binding protein [Candidatus Schekmanbacteria bacterium]
MKIRLMIIVLLSSAVIFLMSFQPAHSASIEVVTTTPDLKSITEYIGGDKVSVTSISTGYQDPHFIDAKPSYMIKAKRADLFIKVGLELEIGWESLIIEGSRNPKIQPGAQGNLDVSEGVMRLQVPTGKIDRSMGDIHPCGNPHYWTDPLNGKIIAKNITNRLCSIYPSDAPYFQKNLSLFNSRIDEALFGKKLTDKVGGEKLSDLLAGGKFYEFIKSNNLQGELGGWMAEVMPFQNAKIVTYHNSWPYFASRFGLHIIDQLEPKPGIPPGPTHINEVIEQMKSGNVKVILMEPFYADKPAKLVAEKTGAKIVVAPNSVGGSDKAKDYVSLIDAILQSIVAAMKN